MLRLKTVCGLTAAVGSAFYLTHDRIIPKIYLKDSNDSPLNVNSFYQSLLSSNLKSLKQQLIKNPNLVNHRHLSGLMPLHVAVCHQNHSLVQFLLENGAKVDEQDLNDRQYWQERMVFLTSKIHPMAPTNGFTALHYAVVLDDLATLELLMEKNADPLIKDDRGYMAIDYFDEQEQNPKLHQRLSEYTAQYSEIQKQKERQKRLEFPMEEFFQKSIVGQEGPIQSLSSAVRRKQNGWYDDERPLVFLFLGSSGIGKTELAKQLSKYLHKDSKQPFIRLDMSEFQSKHEVSKLFGAPPGYLGYDEGSPFIEKLQKCPNAVVLLDEVEKAHIDVLTVMLQVFDEGRLTDGKGNTVDCRDAIFIMTSNLGQREISDEAESLREAKEEDQKSFMDQIIYPILRNHFKRDEFLGRINDILLFLPFSQTELEKIVEMELQKWKQRSFEKHEIGLKWSRDLIDVLSRGYNIHYGARSIKHEVEKKVIAPIAKEYEIGKVSQGDSISLSIVNGRIDIRIEKGEKKNSFGSWFK